MFNSISDMPEQISKEYVSRPFDVQWEQLKNNKKIYLVYLGNNFHTQYVFVSSSSIPKNPFMDSQCVPSVGNEIDWLVCIKTIIVLINACLLTKTSHGFNANKVPKAVHSNMLSGLHEPNHNSKWTMLLYKIPLEHVN